MDVNRVEEILNSPEKITVTYQGDPVWIQSVNDVTQIASVYALDNQKNEKNVPVSELQEG
ncbi:H-type small acid-soluble spore protein [Shimazuella kribbensis]|uniref:H-type small acid-soluble spore protein n=1 Tax=Shimazuella kribbensis TaxID=139808 RepID=UPI00040862D3|nr:H-type small acid-soluble spore protein [Shimazuella kribbensis]